MELIEAQKILDHEVRYKNIYFKVRRIVNNDTIEIKAVIQVKDACSGYAYEQSSTIPITTVEYISESYFEDLGKEDLVHLAYNACRRLEMHELDEHFKVNGVCFKDPHPELKKIEQKYDWKRQA